MALMATPGSGYGGAGIATDGSVGARLTIAGANAGAGNFTIPQAVGSLVGNNLFHSFSTFNIDAGQTATFTTSTASIANVISRVSGGSASQINGMMQLSALAGTPAFFFINPAGVTFGAGAAINVPGAFHVSTADYVKFANGDKFYADLGQGGTLSIAAPAAFGFLGTTRAPITVMDGATLSAQTSQPVSIVAGDLEVNNGLVRARGGDIRIVALGQAAQEIGFTGVLPAASGNLDILNGGLIAARSVDALESGAITVSAGHINIDSLASDNYTGILNLAFAEGNAGPITVRAGSIDILGRASAGFPAGILSQAWTGTGNAGSVDISATGAVSIFNGGQIAADTFSAGNAGRVKVNAGSISVDGQGSIGDGFSYGNTGISSKAYRDSTGNAGSVEVTAPGTLSLVNGGQISADTWASGDAGAVSVSAGSITVNAQNSEYFTGIFSQANAGTGKAGSVEVAATGDLSLINGGQISADAWALGEAGAIKVNAGSITIDRRGSDQYTGIFSRALGNVESTAHAGSVEVLATGNLSVVNGGIIASNTFSAGDAGTVKVSAGSITIDAQDSSFFTGIFSQTTQGTGNAGDVEVVATGNLSLVHGGEIASNTFTSGHAGTIKVSAGSITIDEQGSNSFTGIFSQASDGSGNAGSVDVSAAGSISLVNGGEIASNTSTSGHAGTIKVRADSITIDKQGSNSFTGIFSQSFPGSTGNAGSVAVSATGNLSLVHGGEISSDTYTSGHAGTVTISAGSMAIDRQGSGTPTGIFSQAQAGTGDAGSVNVSVAGNITLVNGGEIASNTNSSGHAGTLEVSAGKIVIENGGEISSGTFASGGAGTVTVSAGSIAIDRQGSGTPTGIFSQANAGTGNAGSVHVSATEELSLDDGGAISSNTYSSGHAGTIKVSAGRIVLDDAGSISSSTYSSGDAGTVKVSAGSMAIGSMRSGSSGYILSAAVYGTGNAGSVDVAVTGNLSLDHGGVISSSTLTTGNAGTVNVSADNIAIGSQGNVSGGGISSQAEGGTGNAGSVDVSATGSLSVEHGGIITSNTLTAGNAGSVTVRAGSLRVDGDSSKISAAAAKGSSGQTGLVSVAADGIMLSNGGQISIENQATVPSPSTLAPTSINVTAQNINIVNSPNAISTSSTGNVSAGSIRINANDTLHLDPSGITTTANDGNGGAIDIATNLLWLENSRITTSVTGLLNGNGGNISISANSLIMDTGFIQANTTAQYASGGLVSISAQNLVASGNTLLLGGSLPYSYQPGVFGFNVIQAAAPTGVSGVVDLSAPPLDVSTSLVGLDTRLLKGGLIARRLCESSGGSSLVPSGRGGLLPGRADFLSPSQLSGIGAAASPTAGGLAVQTSPRADVFALCLAGL